MKLFRLFCVFSFLLAGVYGAVVDLPGPFEAEYSEDFSGFSYGSYNSIDVFGSSGARLCYEAGLENKVRTASSLVSGAYAVNPRSGPVFAGSLGGMLTWVFEDENLAMMFGGYFNVLKVPGNGPNATAYFYNTDEQVIAVEHIFAPYSSWRFNGWEFDMPIKKILVIGNPIEEPVSGGYVMFDDMIYSTVPEPGCIGFVLCGMLYLKRMFH